VAENSVEKPVESIVAQGVDDEPIVANARLFQGRLAIVASVMSAFYAAFHMAALNGLSIGDLTGVTLPFLPRFPMETWNFRIVHVAGALLLGFMLFASVRFTDKQDSDLRPNAVVRAASWLLLLPALFSVGAATWFGTLIEGGCLGTAWMPRFNSVKPSCSGYRSWWLRSAPFCCHGWNACRATRFRSRT
jgi:cytochrome bd-type quinol oxidase subunit 1